MRIRRFQAPDMRTALRMVREEQGEHAVILSSERNGDGIEVVAATDYDEALVRRALRGETPTPTQPPVCEPAPAFASAAWPHEAPASMPPMPSMPSMPTMPSKPAPAASAAGELSDLAGLAAMAAAPMPKAPAAPQKQAAASAATGSRRAVFDVPPGPAEMPAPVAMSRPAASQPAASRPAETIAAARAVPAMPSFARAEAPLSFAAHLRDNAPLTALHELEAARALPAPLLERLIDPPSASATATAAPAAAPPSANDEAGDEAEELMDALADVVATDAAPEATPDVEEATPRVVRTENADATPALTAVPSPDPTVEALRQELAQMRSLIEREMGQFTDERLRGVPVRGAILQELTGYGCEAELARAIAASIPPNLEVGVARGRALALLAKSLIVAEREPLEDGGVIALVGPTGVGKTTTLAKLAARYAASHSPRDVALVTLDSYRIGAREQLAEFGRRLGMPVIDASREGLAETLERLADYPLVLVDTAGLGQRDRALAAQFNWISAARRVRSYLVLPANARNEDLDEVIRRFRCASPEGVILSKLDETGRLGGALSVLIRQRLPVTYVTDGQRVPEDLQRAHAHRLVLRLGELRRAAQDDTDDGEKNHAAA